MDEKAKKYRLDKTSFQLMNVEEADHSMRYYKEISWKERLSISYFLTGMAYSFDLDNPPRLNKAIFNIKKKDA